MTSIKIPLLTASDIEVKIKQVTKAGALALLYKTARTDRKYLNQVYGPMNWTSDYKVIKDNLYCGIGVREDADHDFVWKYDCGIESRADDEGNEKKGEASDAFKRAGFQWGIGEELYSAPFIWLSVETEQDSSGKWKLKNAFSHYSVGHIEYDEKTRTIVGLNIINNKGIEVFTYTDPDYTAPTTNKGAKASNKPVETNSNANSINTKTVEKMPLKTLIGQVGKMIKTMYEANGNMDEYANIVVDVTGDKQFKCNQATEEQYDLVLDIYNRLIDAGYKK